MMETLMGGSTFREEPEVDAGELRPVGGRRDIIGTQARRAGDQTEIFLNLHYVVR
jgi:hypothetical protein